MAKKTETTDTMTKKSAIERIKTWCTRTGLNEEQYIEEFDEYIEIGDSIKWGLEQVKASMSFAKSSDTDNVHMYILEAGKTERREEDLDVAEGERGRWKTVGYKGKGLVVYQKLPKTVEESVGPWSLGSLDGSDKVAKLIKGKCYKVRVSIFPGKDSPDRVTVSASAASDKVDEKPSQDIINELLDSYELYTIKLVSEFDPTQYGVFGAYQGRVVGHKTGKAWEKSLILIDDSVDVGDEPGAFEARMDSVDQVNQIEKMSTVTMYGNIRNPEKGLPSITPLYTVVTPPPKRAKRPAFGKKKNNNEEDEKPKKGKKKVEEEEEEEEEEDEVTVDEDEEESPKVKKGKKAPVVEEEEEEEEDEEEEEEEEEEPEEKPKKKGKKGAKGCKKYETGWKLGSDACNECKMIDTEGYMNCKKATKAAK